MRTKFLLSAGLAFLSGSAVCWADDGWEKRIVSLTWENDAIAGTDQHFTQGARIEYLSADNTLPSWLQSFSSFLPSLGYEVEAQKYGLACGQEIYTPADLDNPNPIPDDRPYAGWLYTRAMLQRRGQGPWNLLTREKLHLDLGVIGPESLAEDTQKTWHSRSPQGWSHQLRTEIAFLLRYQRDYLVQFRNSESDWGLDLIPHVGAAGGTVQSFVNLGATMRFGYRLPNEFAWGTSSVPWGIYGFTTFDGRAVFRNIFLDGNTFVKSPHVAKEPLVGEFVAGLTLVFRHFEATGSYALRTREFTSQDGVTESYGSASLRFKF